MTILTLTTGTIFIMWLGEQITERGIGNGISLIIFAGIVANLPQAIFGLFQQLRNGTLSIITLLFVLVFMVAIIAFVVFVERAQRRIPVQYAKRVVGRRVYGGQNTYLPLRVNTGGVIPIIFAISILSLPSYLAQISGAEWMKRVATSLVDGAPPLPAVLRGRHPFLLLLLHVDRLQPDRHRRQHAQVRRVHPRHPAGQEDRRLHRHGPFPDHDRGRGVPDLRRPAPGHPQQRA